jgi:hypothetical protein
MRLTNRHLVRSFAAGFLMVTLHLPASVLSQGPGQEVEVERVKPANGKHPSLRFLKENRDFLRAQLDLLRQTVLEREGNVDLLSDRHLLFQEMLSAILAAQDTVATEQDRMDQWELLASVRDLADLEAQLDLMQLLLDEQQNRLVQLEADFVGRQETALVILLRGYPEEDGPAAVIFAEEGQSTLRVPLSEGDRAALRAGGVAQVFHEFVEPREHRWSITFEGDGWSERAPDPLVLEPARDRMTFVQLELGPLRPSGPEVATLTTVWEK